MKNLFASILVLFVAGVLCAEDKKAKEPILAVETAKGDKFEIKEGKFAEPTKVTTAEELEKLIPDETTRKRIAGEFDLKTHVLLAFSWEGSGGDKLEYAILESFPEQIKFSKKRGETDDLRKHLKLFAVRKDVKWSAK